MNVYSVIIFITGAATLALELLASRIMTPYFGVSLYIWTGILSITLISLALGYFFGGKISHRFNSHSEREFGFLVMPAASAISLGIASLVYPWAFFQLAQINLVVGSFVACVILLFVPLVTISAMNPLLVSLRNNFDVTPEKRGDSGSGLVFFISTTGSVIGVWVTAFLFIPNITNFKSVLILGFTLASVSMSMCLRSSNLTGIGKKFLLLTALSGMLLCGSLLAFSARYLHKDEAILYNGYYWKIDKEYTSLFGNTKILSVAKNHPHDREHTANPEMSYKLYFQDGILQDLVDQNGISQDIYSYAMEALGATDISRNSRILVLGLAGGIVPMSLAKDGINVDVVEINPSAVIAAQEFFDFDPQQVTLYQMDARNYVNQCRWSYNRIIVDLFQGDGIPDYLLSRNFFHDLKNCISADGAIVLNTFAVPKLMPVFYYLLKTIKSEFEQLYMFHDDFSNPDETMGVYLVAGNKAYQPRLRLAMQKVPPHLQEQLRRIFSGARDIDGNLLRESSVITDEYNIFPILNVDNYLTYRKTAIHAVPYQFLVN